MIEPGKSDQESFAPLLAVGSAIQNLVATRLGRGFVPMAIMLGFGVVQFASEGWTRSSVELVAGSMLAALAMLGYGLRVARLAFGHAERLWMDFAMSASIIPPVFSLCLLVWRGLRGFVSGEGLSGVATAIFFTIIGGWAMRAWMRVVEVERLAGVMSMGSPTEIPR
jgi:hypothetical protein